MITTDTKTRFSRASAVWLLIAGAGLTVWGLWSFISFIVSWGFNDQGYPATNTVALVFTLLIIPGLLLIFAAYSTWHTERWWYSFICAVMLTVGIAWFGASGAAWHICIPLLGLSIAAGVLLVISKDEFY
jgi:hypothetical protein